MKKFLIVLLSLVIVLVFAGCTSNNTDTTPQETEQNQEEEAVNVTKMNIEVSGETFVATLENNKATEQLVDMMKNGPITLSLSDYSGFEKVGPLGASLSTESDEQMTTSSGDIVLYSGNQIVMFYGSNSWSYTKLAHVDDLSGWEKALGSGDVEVTISIS